MGRNTATQQPMWPEGEDLALFSGTPPSAVDAPFDPRPAARADRLPGIGAPEWEELAREQDRQRQPRLWTEWLGQVEPPSRSSDTEERSSNGTQEGQGHGPTPSRPGESGVSG